MKQNSEFDMQIDLLFDFQRFQGNDRLSQMISDVENRYSQELSDEDLRMVNAAGELDVLRVEKNDGVDVT